MKDKFDGVIRVDVDPEDDINYIENYIRALPPESRRIAYKLWWRSTKQSWELMGYALDKIIKNLQEMRHPKWPKTEKGWLEWKTICEYMQRLDNEYAEMDLDLKKPRLADYADYLFTCGYHGNNGKPYGDQILREIKKAGDEGYL